MQTINCSFTNLEDLERLIENNNYSKNQNLLIQIFTSDLENNYLSTIVSLLASKLPQATVIGSTTDGEIYDGKATTNSTIISFTAFGSTTVKAKVYELNTIQFKLGQQIARDMCDPDTKAVILLADGLHTNGDDLLEGFHDINQKVIIAGGLAGDYRCMQKTLVICQSEIKQNSVVACALTGTDLIVNTQNLFGWHPIGKNMLVTKAQGNRLYELDGMPLRDIYAKYLGANVAEKLPVSAGEYPLIINRYEKIIARAALNLFPDGSMLYAGNFKIGDKVQFGYGHVPLILTSARDNIKNLGKLPIESIYIYSCSARKYFMGAEVDKEILPLEFLSSTAGFFTYGEFYRDGTKEKSVTMLLNESMTLLLLSENPNATKEYVLGSLEEEQKTTEHMYHKLFHLIDATGKELTDTNEKLEALVEEKTKQITEKVFFDSLTKLPNRNKLLADLTAGSNFIPMMLAIINIDDFKQVNDYYGYKVGDQLLMEISCAINEAVKNDVNADKLKLYKLPIDEYAIAGNTDMLTKDFTDFIENNINAVFVNEVAVDGNSFFLNNTVGLSLGRAESNDYLDEAAGVLLQANMALREAKDIKARQVKYHSEMSVKKQLEHNVLWTSKIKQAIKDDRFIPYFQPIFTSATGEVEKYECLIRMIDADGTIVAPYVFLDIARQAKLYIDLTKIMIDKCFKIFSENKLNFSIADLSNDKTVQYLITKIYEFKIGKQLTLEILETESVDDYEMLSDFIKTIKQYGCQIAIDDFGSGYSNFEHVAKLDIDYLKIDGSLIKNITKDNQVKLMVDMIIKFCAKINIKTVAEFVSDEAICVMVKEMGIDYLQGFYLGVPGATCK